MPFVTLADSTSLYYEEAGEGDPLLFIHGWSQCSSVWKLQLRHFSERYRCIAFDLRGHGRSMPSASGYGMEALSSDVAELFDRFSLRGVTLVGWSLGALVALAAYPSVRERLASLAFVSGTSKYCSCDGYPYGLPPKEPRALSLLLRKEPRGALDGFLREMFAGEDEREGGLYYFEQNILPFLPPPRQDALEQSLRTLLRTDLRAALSSIHTPTLLVHGEEDRICPVTASRYMAERIPGASLVVLSGVGHAPMISRPKELNTVMETFLESIYA